MDIFYTAIPDSLKWKIVPNMLSHIPREDIEEPILRAGVNYDNWTHLSRNCIEPSEGCFVTAIHSYPGPILVVNGEKDDRPSEARFVQAAAKAKLHVIKGTNIELLVIYANVSVTKRSHIFCDLRERKARRVE